MSTFGTKTPDSASSARRLVRVFEVSIPERYAICRDSQSGAVRVSLDACVGAMAVFPSPGEEWLIVRIGSTWYLERRTGTQNPAYTTPHGMGDWVLYNPSGRIILRDKDGTVGGASGVRFGNVADRRIDPGSTVRSVEVLDAATGDRLGFVPLYS